MSNDKLLENYQQQRLKRRFDDTELFSLDHTIVSFILPRLREFYKIHCKIHPLSNYPKDEINDEKTI